MARKAQSELFNDASHAMNELNHMIAMFESENFKLRKLVMDLWQQLLNTYDRKEVEEFMERIRELGIEES